MQPILADYTVSATELQNNYEQIISEAVGAVAVFNHNQPEAYLIPARYYERLMDYLEDLQDAQTIRERSNEKAIRVNLNDL